MSCALEPFCACVIDANDDVIKLCAPHQDVVDKAVAAERAACAKIVATEDDTALSWSAM